ncbi:hypothetical protein ACIP9H_21660 [Streptomyces sp. NPDC088732]|uniref:hypothetical protein n=1 Tax=Streptomyces sp. NPDC088732 TaxID=3365879 RepID=UPI0037FDE2AB
MGGGIMMWSAAGDTDIAAESVIALIGFAAGVVLASVNAVHARHNESRRQRAERAGDALVDFMRGIAENAQYRGRLYGAGPAVTAARAAELEDRITESLVLVSSAKARLATYGNAEAGRILAAIERDGGFVGSDPVAQRRLSELVAALRAELRLSGNLKAEEIRDVLFGPPRGPSSA